MQKKKILSLAIATATVVTGLVGVTTAYDSLDVLDNGDLKVCGTEYISDSNGSGGCITIQGKNVGATTTGAGPSAPEESYGNYYQWGDNTPCTEENWLEDYVSDNNAWGGGNDIFDSNEWKPTNSYPVENERERQGPCDPGYHVPSVGERYALMDMWAGSSVNGGMDYNLQFYMDFQIPFAAYRSDEDGYPGYLYGPDDARLWSSSPYVLYDDEAFYFSINGYNRIFVDPYRRIYGFPVRCFKDSALGSSSSEGGDGLITVNIAALNGGQNTCSLDNYIFSGIFASPSVVFRNISQSMHCIFGDAGSKAVTLELSGNLTDGSGNIIPGGNVRLKNSAWTATPSGIQTGNTAIAEYTGLNKTITLFNKVANKIGEATGAGVDIQIEVPGGTPNGVYNGVLVLSY